MKHEYGELCRPPQLWQQRLLPQAEYCNISIFSSAHVYSVGMIYSVRFYCCLNAGRLSPRYPRIYGEAEPSRVRSLPLCSAEVKGVKEKSSKPPPSLLSFIHQLVSTFPLTVPYMTLQK